ncbi:MAG: hypothetical protein EA393_13185, partial [Bacteroidetes bacterium]
MNGTSKLRFSTFDPARAGFRTLQVLNIKHQKRYIHLTYNTRHIVHFDLDTFFVSVERLLNSSLQGKPVIIGSVAGRGVVASCSYETRRYGVRSAMPMKMALQLCPDAIVIRGDMEAY